MATVQHPMFSDVTHDVAEADVSTWVKAGWKRKGSAKAKADSDDDTPKSSTGKTKKK